MCEWAVTTFWGAGVEAGMKATLSWAGVGDALQTSSGWVPMGDGHGRAVYTQAQCLLH